MREWSQRRHWRLIERNIPMYG